ncbi:hypothetical protein, partial [Lactiplantibacillus pentosus]|uniref:hypothetical protein n=1 Tax=Lactiplantibacillus pentosus TaxID=1589 RepID=UPI001CDBC649
CLEAGLGRIHHSKFTVTRTVSSGSQLAAFELKNLKLACFNHDSCQISWTPNIISWTEKNHYPSR